METTHRNQHVMDFFESIGIDPKTVAVKDFDHRGYRTFVYRDDAPNQRVLLQGDDYAATEYHVWPSGEVAAEAVRAYWMDAKVTVGR